ncbi:type 2 lanthipeptide synthetase LanM family protein [Sorangium sp. So ce1504]|uniref:type 2 lanthipeptide synthetase LanM family protein n=1 Tax=Sorangium sp. So ce1504 TaxID=3133337 RepID=UPI003F63ACD0
MSDEAAFAERLRSAGLDREGLLQILADDGPAAGASTGSGTWRDGIEQILEDRCAGDALPSIPSPHTAPAMPARPFFPGFLRPFLQAGVAQLRAGLAEIGARYPLTGPRLTEDAAAMLVASLARRLEGSALRTLVLELHIAAMRDKLPQATSEERFAHFATAYWEAPGARATLLSKVPVLARLLSTDLSRWVETNLELLARLAEDEALIRGAFISGERIGDVAALEIGAGDLHRRGRSVARIAFTSGLSLVYKPRSLAIDVQFQRLLGWLNDNGLSAPHRTLTVLDRGSHGWVELVEEMGCETRVAVERFYRRQGSLLALLHVLRAIDFHRENLIAAGEHPVLIDLEALFHNEAPVLAGDTAAHRALALLRDSVLDTGLLPLILPGDGVGADFSGLGGEAGQSGQHLVPGLDETSRDVMKIVRCRPLIGESNNRPRLHGELVDPAPFVEEIVDGFRETYLFIVRRRNELSDNFGSFAGVETRHLLRQTMRYALLLSEATHPDFLRDGLARDMLLDKLWVEAAHRPELRRVVPFESADLRLGDILVFTARPGERHLWSSAGDRIDDFFERDSLSLVLDRLASMSEDGCLAQISLLRASFVAFEKDHIASDRALLSPDSAPRGLAEAGDALAMAVAIGEDLVTRAIRGRDDVTWIGATLVDLERGRWSLSPLPTGLYDGVGGMALFFAHLAAATGRGDFEALARASLAPILREIRGDDRAAPAALGAFTGRASHLHVLGQLAALWGDSTLLDGALSLLPALDAQIDGDEQLDLLGGAAGCAVVLLALHRQTGDARALASARRCGERLLARAAPTPDGGIAWKAPQAERPLGGFSHGVAGIAWALLELGAATSDERYRDAAQRGLVHERSLFAPARGNWLDMRRPIPRRSGPGERVMTMWCHGAPGIALGRILSLPHMDDPTVRSEIDIGLETTLREGFGRGHSLCHGDMGNADVLLVAAEALDDPRYREAAFVRAADTLAEARQHGFRCGVPGERESPSLMVGLAGIGLGMLRLWSPETVPSVLCLGEGRWRRPASNDGREPDTLRDAIAPSHGEVT